MKASLLILIVVASMSLCFGQEVIPEKTYEDYKRAGNSQLIIGAIFTGASIPIFVRLFSGEENFDNYPIMIAGGVILLGGGIALLSSSGKNYRRARELSTNVVYQPIDGVRVTSKQASGAPGISVRLNF
jgi:hypothetical protein